MPESTEATTAMLRLDLLRTYKLSWLPGDLLSGVIIFMVTIPAAMAYSQMAGLQPINGLYASLLAMALYALLGTSRQLIIDAEATMAILVASSLAAVGAGSDPARWLALATMQAIMIGAIQLTAGVARVGFIADFIPKSVITGFLNGMALIIIVSQLGKISGINLTQEDFFPRIWEFYNKIHQFHQPTLIIGGACLVGLFLFRFVPILPEAVLVVVLATVAVICGGFGGPGSQTGGLNPRRTAAPGNSQCWVQRYSGPDTLCRGHGPGLLFRYHNHRPGLCPEGRLPDRPQSRHDCLGSGQYRGRVVPRVRLRLQPIPYRGERYVWRQKPICRPHGRRPARPVSA